MRRKGTPSVIRRGGTLQGDCPEHPACSSPSGGGCREATGEGEKCKASASRHFQPPVMIRASPSSAPVCALGHLPPLGEGRQRRGSAGTSSGASRHLSTLRCPKNAAGLRFPLHFSTAAEKEPSLYPPLAARGLLSPVRGEGFCRAVPLRRFATPLPDAGRGKRCETGIPRARGDEGDADDTVKLSFHYEHIDHIFYFCLNFSTLSSLLSFPISCIMTISMLFCALQCEFHLRERYYHG